MSISDCFDMEDALAWDHWQDLDIDCIECLNLSLQHVCDACGAPLCPNCHTSGEGICSEHNSHAEAC